MKQYKVIALSVGADSGKIYSAGDIVPADAFPDGRADELVGSGFLEPYTGKKNEHSAFAGVPHVVTAADIEHNPGSDLVEGETIYLPFDGFVMDDAANHSTNEEGAASHEGKVLVNLSEAKDPNTPPIAPAKPVEPTANLADIINAAMTEPIVDAPTVKADTKKK